MSTPLSPASLAVRSALADMRAVMPLIHGEGGKDVLAGALCALASVQAAVDTDPMERIATALDVLAQEATARAARERAALVAEQTALLYRLMTTAADARVADTCDLAGRYALGPAERAARLEAAQVARERVVAWNHAHPERGSTHRLRAHPTGIRALAEEGAA